VNSAGLMRGAYAFSSSREEELVHPAAASTTTNPTIALNTVICLTSFTRLSLTRKD
jgi:hypothetical protein